MRTPVRVGRGVAITVVQRATRGLVSSLTRARRVASPEDWLGSRIKEMQSRYRSTADNRRNAILMGTRVQATHNAAAPPKPSQRSRAAGWVLAMRASRYR